MCWSFPLDVVLIRNFFLVAESHFSLLHAVSFLHCIFNYAVDPEARVRYPALPGKKVVGLEQGPLSLMNTTEELLDRKVAAPVYKTENTAVGTRPADHVSPSIRKSWQSLRRQAAVARSV
jgi:hypothetical protein